MISRRSFARLFVSAVLITPGCGSSGVQDPGEKDPPTGIQGEYLGQTAPGLAPQLFAPGIVSKEGIEGNLLLCSSGNELYFVVVGTRNGAVAATIYGTNVQGTFWTTPQVVSFSGVGAYSDAYIALHPNGTRMYFQSNRPIDPSESSFEWNIWYVDRVGDGWGEPVSIGRPINGRNHTSGPSVTSDGTLYYTVLELGGASELFRSRLVNGEYQEPEKLPDAVNSLFQQFDSYVAPDGSYLIYNGAEQAGHGNPIYLYVSFQDEEGNWSDSEKLGPEINVSDLIGSATISPDMRFLTFSRPSENSQMEWDVYWVDAQVVQTYR